jgi:iron complex outermembrane receptor protein
LFSAAGYAAEPLPTMVVTATRAPLLLEHATGDVTLVSESEIAARHVQRLSDIIKFVPGVFTAPGKGVLQSFSGFALRGVPDDRRTLLLVDGVPMNDGYTGSTYLGGLAADSVIQAEVLSGPMSSMFGGSAMGGVVNFVTRMPQAPEFGLTLGYGDPFDRGTAPESVSRAALHAGTRLDNGLALRATAHWAGTRGYRADWVTAATNPAGTTGAQPLTLETGAAGFHLGKKGENSWQENSATLKLEQTLTGGTHWQLGWQWQTYDFGFGAPETYLRTAAGASTFGAAATALGFAGNDGGFARQVVNGGVDADLGVGRAYLRANYSRTAENFSITPTAGATSGAGRITDSPAQSLNLDAYWTAALGTATLGTHGLTLGVSHHQDRADSQTYTLSNWADPASRTTRYSQATGKTTLLAAYVQDEWQLTPIVTLQAGLRRDHWQHHEGYSLDPTGAVNHPERTASAWSPKLGASLRPLAGLTLRASAGTAFRAPSIYDLYRSAKFTTYSITANPALKPETVRTWDAGAEWRGWAGGEVRLGVFNNDLRDLIYVQGSGAARTRINAGRAESHGVTFSFNQNFSAGHRFFANMTRTLSEMKENSVSPTSVGKRLTGLPDKQASAGIEARHGALTLSASARYAGKQFSTDDNSDTASHTYKAYDAYTVADLKLSYRWERGVTASFSVDNLFDRDYFSYYAAPRRSWFAELSYQY